MHNSVLFILVWLTAISPCVVAQNLWQEIDPPELNGRELTCIVPWNGGVRAYFSSDTQTGESAYWYESSDGESWIGPKWGERYSLNSTVRLQGLIDGRTTFDTYLDDSLAGGDPHPFEPKTMEIIYTSPLGKRKAIVDEGAYLYLPDLSHELIDVLATSPELAIESALYYYDEKLPLSHVNDAVEFLGEDVAVGAGGGYNTDGALARYDGNTWEIDTESWGWQSNYNDLNLIAEGNGVCVVVQNDDGYVYPDESKMYWSDDLSDWKDVDLSFGLEYSDEVVIRSLRFLSGQFVIVGDIYNYYSIIDSFIASSVDGEVWTLVRLSGVEGLRDINLNGSQWCAVGEDGLVLESSDGAFWNQRPDSGMDLVKVLYAGGRWVVTDEKGGIHTSVDLETWVLQSEQAGLFLTKTSTSLVASDGDRFWVSLFASPGMPDVTGQPEGDVILPGDTVTLSVIAEGDESLTYQWYEGLSGDVSNPVSGANGTSYTTPALSETTQYWVRVSNALAYDDSGSAEIIIATQPVITDQPAGLLVDMGDYKRLSVTAAGGGLSYQWYGGLPGDVSQPLAGQTQSSLYAPSQLPGRFIYWVRVTNLSGYTDSQGAEVVVAPVLPNIYEQDLGSTVIAYDYAYYLVRASGPYLSYQWYQGVAGDTSAPITRTSNSYYPDTTMIGDFQYWVRVSNAAGSVDSATINLTVAPAFPVITDQAENAYTNVGASVYLSVSAQPYNDLTYQWYHGVSGDISQPINQTYSSYFPDTDAVGLSRHWVRVTNPFGSDDSRTFSITVRPSNYAEWAEGNALPTDGSGLGAPGASATGDGVSNLQKYALGLLATEHSNWQVEHEWYDAPSTGKRYAALWVRTLQGLADVEVGAEETMNLITWSDSAVATGNVLQHGDGTVSRQFRCSLSISENPSCFMRASLKYAPED